MKKQRNYSQLKEQEKSSEKPKMKYLSRLQVEKVIKMLKELINITNRNADRCNNELETIKRNQSILDNSVAKIKTDLKAMNS